MAAVSRTAGTGISANPDLPDAWSATENIAWKTAIPGRGWSSPIAWGDKIFLTSVTSADDQVERSGLVFRRRFENAPDPHEWRAFCLDRASGRILWQLQRTKECRRNPCT